MVSGKLHAVLTHGCRRHVKLKDFDHVASTCRRALIFMLKKLRAKHRPRKLWFSLPCTKFCQWTQVNYSTPERQEQLRGYQRKERKMLWNFNDFVKDTLEKDETVDIYFEWTHPCKGWAEAPMQDLEHHLQKIGHEWLPCRVDGCTFFTRSG